jgi:hypothetical protein
LHGSGLQLVDIVELGKVNALPSNVANGEDTDVWHFLLHQLHEFGLGKLRACDERASGNELRAVPPGLSTLPPVTVAVGWKGALPPTWIASLMPMRCTKPPPPARKTVEGLI